MYSPAPARYDMMKYRRVGATGLVLPEISLGLWQNFGAGMLDKARALCRTAFDHGVTHFDLANNYGPPPGAAEETLGQLLASDFKGLRDELVVSTKAGYRMWPGPYGNGGSRKYLISSLDQSLMRLGLDYVDIFYSHRFDPDTPLEETMGALDHIVRSGRALYVGLSNYTASETARASAILGDLGTPAIIHQPSYSILNRWLEGDGLLDRLDIEGMGCICFSPLSQGLLTAKYLGGIPEGSRASRQDGPLPPEALTPAVRDSLNQLNRIAAERGQTLAQMAIAWVLRDPRMTSALVGASRPEQLIDSLGALSGPAFSAEELAAIDRAAIDVGDI